MGRLLICGGTAWLGRAIGAAAIGAGWQVTCLARGASGEVPAGADLVVADRDGPDPFAGLAGEWDAVVDLTRQPGHARRAIAALADRAAHWTLISTANVYADLSGPLVEGAPLRPALVDDHAELQRYGEGKVACEQAVAQHPRVSVLRAGLLVGPGDPSDRFGYWPAAFARAGAAPVLVPAADDLPVQVLDVRDLAEFVVEGIGERVGTCHVAGPATTLGAVLAAAREAAGHHGSVVRRDLADLTAAGVQPWSGERSLPLWLPPEAIGMAQLSTERARGAGLAWRPLAETLADTLVDERARGLDRPRRAGLTRADELRLLGLPA